MLEPKDANTGPGAYLVEVCFCLKTRSQSNCLFFEANKPVHTHLDGGRSWERLGEGQHLIIYWKWKCVHNTVEPLSFHSWHEVWKRQMIPLQKHHPPTRFTANSVNHSDCPNGRLWLFVGPVRSYCHLQREQCVFAERETLRWPVEHASPISSLTTGSNGIENIHWRDCRASQWSIHESPGCCLFPLILPFFHSFIFYECN